MGFRFKLLFKCFNTIPKLNDYLNWAFRRGTCGCAKCRRAGEDAGNLSLTEISILLTVYSVKSGIIPGFEFRSACLDSWQWQSVLK